MLRRIAVLALLLGILPVAVQALPRGSGPYAPAAIHSAQDRLLRLGSLFGDLWKPATENTGKSIDRDGQPKPQQQDGPPLPRSGGGLGRGSSPSRVRDQP